MAGRRCGSVCIQPGENGTRQRPLARRRQRPAVAAVGRWRPPCRLRRVGFVSRSAPAFLQAKCQPRSLPNFD